MKDEKGIQIGSFINWEEFSGKMHRGFVKEIDSNDAIIDCEMCQKECSCHDVNQKQDE